MMVALLLFIVSLEVVEAIYNVTNTDTTQTGIDISSPLDSSTAQCLADEGIYFIIPRAYHSSCSVDTGACTSITAAKQAGIKKRDIYMFPSPSCDKTASEQVSDMLNMMVTQGCSGDWSGRVWLDIEDSNNLYWGTDTKANQAFYESLVDACKAQATSCGVYASSRQWSDVFGSTSYTYGNDLPLWYPHYDNDPSFDDFVAFGGWSSPLVKQYDGTSTICNFGVDINYSQKF